MVGRYGAGAGCELKGQRDAPPTLPSIATDSMLASLDSASIDSCAYIRAPARLPAPKAPAVSCLKNSDP